MLDIGKLKKEVERKRRDYEIAKGRRERSLDTLKAKYGVSTIKAARKKVNSLNAQLASKEVQFVELEEKIKKALKGH